MSKKIKSLALVAATIATTSVPCMAQTCASQSSCGTCLSVGALVVALAALFMALKAMRDSKRAMINATEEFQIMLESTKNSIDKDIKNLRREVRGKGGNRKPSGENNGENAENKSNEGGRNNHHHRQYRRPQQNEGESNAPQPTEPEE
ncbi:MAG: hypothetical protein II671_03970 [Salinivirgaceae bacterium]|nr:hypothetical protein [Salinivirgaceae bacterium]